MAKHPPTPFTVYTDSRVYVYDTPVNMACGFPKLSEYVRDNLRRDVDSGDLFVFVNKKLNYIKVLYQNADGMCLFCKRLPVGKKFALDYTQKTLTLKSLADVVDCVAGTSVVRYRKAA